MKKSNFIPDYVDFVQPSPFPWPVACICIDDFGTRFSPEENLRKKGIENTNIQILNLKAKH